MIFVTLGSQKFQFNRLLQKIDDLISKGSITDEIFAQSGASDYRPKYYAFKAFLGRDEFQEYMEKCNTVITHGGTGAIINAVKLEKKVIAVPRLAKYTVIILQKEKISEHLPGQSRTLRSGKNHVHYSRV